ncbi:MAG: hypothetical protein QME94_17645, partial [Anaerolineae bacterium]|nr:hypothetical protein [Anaerolineae bacterium]
AAKIEGFYDVCRVKGLTGDQGVLIPVQNVDNLMLREDVVQAVRAGRFHVYKVRTIDEGMELLTGMPAGELREGEYPEGTVNYLVKRRLRELAEVYQAFSRAAGEEEEEPEGARKPVRREPVPEPRRRRPIFRRARRVRFR